MTASMMRCSDFRRDDHRIDVLGKHPLSDDPCLRAAGYGPKRTRSLFVLTTVGSERTAGDEFPHSARSDTSKAAQSEFLFRCSRNP